MFLMSCFCMNFCHIFNFCLNLFDFKYFPSNYELEIWTQIHKQKHDIKNMILKL